MPIARCALTQRKLTSTPSSTTVSTSAATTRMPVAVTMERVASRPSELQYIGAPEPVVFLLVARVQAHIEEEHAARHEPRRHPRDDPGLLAGRHVEYREGRDEVEGLR